MYTQNAVISHMRGRNEHAAIITVAPLKPAKIHIFPILCAIGNYDPNCQQLYEVAASGESLPLINTYRMTLLSARSISLAGQYLYSIKKYILRSSLYSFSFSFLLTKPLRELGGLRVIEKILKICVTSSAHHECNI